MNNQDPFNNRYMNQRQMKRKLSQKSLTIRLKQTNTKGIGTRIVSFNQTFLAWISSISLENTLICDRTNGKTSHLDYKNLKNLL